MVLAQTVQTIRCSPDDVLEFVMDIERYAEVDAKIRPIFWARRDGDTMEFQFRPKLPGIPLPAPKVVQRVSLTPGKRIDITNAPSPHNKIANRVSRFQASFVCDSVDGGTQVTRTVEITFPAVVRWLLEPRLARRLPAAVEDEIAQAKDHLEQRQSGHDDAGSRNR
jgi:Polyketide cyclase / dehydrase and lipid transport